jgi:hypothetical protein
MSDWIRDDSGLSLRDIEKRQPYKLDPHAFAISKKMPWMRCKKCGLLNLRNAFTEWYIRMGCNAGDHPDYASRCKNTKERTAK